MPRTTSRARVEVEVELPGRGTYTLIAEVMHVVAPNDPGLLSSA